MLALRIKKLREYLSIGTQQELSNLTNMKLSRVQDVERGKVKELKADELILLQEKLLINSWWILTGTGDILINSKDNDINYKEESHKMIDLLDEKKLEIYYYRLKADILENK